MAIKINELAVIRTTEEPVFVLSMEGREITVRRPVQGKDGIRHEVNTFLLEELESLDAKEKRMMDKYAEITALQKASNISNDQATLPFGN